MNNKLSIERIKQYATDPRMCNISDELRSGMVELLAYREVESKPVYWEIAGNLFSTKEEALKPGFRGTPEPLYESPVLSQPVPDELPEPQDSCAGYYRDGWNDCRAAVLSASPVLGQTPINYELLEALKDARYQLYGNGPGNPKIDAAIAKATGESE